MSKSKSSGSAKSTARSAVGPARNDKKNAVTAAKAKKVKFSVPVVTEEEYLTSEDMSEEDEFNSQAEYDSEDGDELDSQDEFGSEDEFDGKELDADSEKRQIFTSEDEYEERPSALELEEETDTEDDAECGDEFEAAESGLEQESDLDTQDPSELSPGVLKERIHATLHILQNWAAAAPTLTQSRSEMLQGWYADLAAYYGYSEFLLEKLMPLFPIAEALQFLEANETPRPVTVRVNTLKTRRKELTTALTSRGVTLESLGSWTPVGMQVFDSPVPIGATPEYLAGHYLLQAAASLLPVQALAPAPGQRVLDMSAAPGGKSTHLAALMRNTGVLYANDASKDRLKSLIANIHRMGARNTIVSNYDARKLPGILGLASFDRVLLDAPCSGTGVIAKDPAVKTSKGPEDFRTLGHLQKELILAAVDLLQVGGSMVYSTCSVCVEENEDIVAYALAKRPGKLRLVDTHIPFGKEGFTAFQGKHFPAQMKLTRRFYPHAHNLDGFFVAKLERL